MADILKGFGKVVRAARESKGVSQEVFADLCGLHRTYIGAVERGERNVSLKNIKNICDALGVTISSIFEQLE